MYFVAKNNCYTTPYLAFPKVQRNGKAEGDQTPACKTCVRPPALHSPRSREAETLARLKVQHVLCGNGLLEHVLQLQLPILQAGPEKQKLW